MSEQFAMHISGNTACNAARQASEELQPLIALSGLMEGLYPNFPLKIQPVDGRARPSSDLTFILVTKGAYFDRYAPWGRYPNYWGNSSRQSICVKTIEKAGLTSEIF